MNNLTLVISGKIVSDSTENRINFWKGFINIQNSIHDIDELKIVGYSLNPEYDDLLNQVYNFDLFKSETKNILTKEYMSKINPLKFEKVFKKNFPITEKNSPNLWFENIASKSRAIELLKSLDLQDDDYVLCTTWNIGCVGDSEVNQVVFDRSLPSDYLYLSYSPYIDHVYSDLWFWGGYKIIKKFESYKDYFLVLINDEDNSRGNELSKIHSKSNIINLLSTFERKIKIYLLNKLPLNGMKRFFSFSTVISRKIIGLEQRIELFMNLPPLTDENSLPMMSSINLAIHPINKNSILKKFIFHKNLRTVTRFLDVHDFEISTHGKMINPKEFCYIIYSHSSFSDCWEMSISQAVENLPQSCKKIYLISELSDKTLMNFKKIKCNDGIDLLTYNDGDKYTDNLIEIFGKIIDKNKFCYFVHENMPLVSKVDSIYLNTLLHYMNNSNEFYIKLVDTKKVNLKKEHSSFPGLVENIGGYSISVQPSLMNIELMMGFLTNFHQDIEDYELTCFKSNFQFSAVNCNLNIDNNILYNKYFPHVSGVIFKGKWCTNKWGNEINALSKKYNIDLSLRGVC